MPQHSISCNSAFQSWCTTECTGASAKPVHGIVHWCTRCTGTRPVCPKTRASWDTNGVPQDGPRRRAVYFRNVYLLNAKALGKMCNPMDYHILPHALPQHYITLPLPACTVAYACVRHYKPQDTTRTCQAITYYCTADHTRHNTST